ncbi:hypothetical protein [Nonomuraea sp. NPDC003709]|uniref:hypothetical protein n=1 Tax=Nonomuraea sp. NPDC003709 TaxID=3154450 RepID=UPI0033B0D280
MIARIRVSVDAAPVSEFDDVHATTQEWIFQTLFQLLGEQPLVADVRATLFRALSTIQGVSVKQDAIDAAGRNGTAFVYTGASGITGTSAGAAWVARTRATAIDVLRGWRQLGPPPKLISLPSVSR